MYECSLKQYGYEKLQIQEPRLVEKQIIDYIIFLKQQGKSYSIIHNYVSAIKAFYQINDVVLNVRKIGKFLPEYRKVRKDRAYTHEEISRLLEISDERMRAIVLLLASSGMCIGAIPFIRLRNVENMENIAKITVYEGTKEEYFTFITPECRKAIDNYMDMRLRYGEILNDNSYLIREQFDLKDPTSKPKQTRSNTMSVRLISMSERIGIRNQGIPAAHGFRKFFTTQLVNSRLNPEIREMLLGHDIGLAGAYYKPTVEEMYAEYEKAIDNLTIDPANRLQRKIETLTIEKSRLDRIEEKMLKMEQIYQK